MKIPLVADLQAQRSSLQSLFAKVLLFSFLLLVADRAFGLMARHGLEIYFGLNRSAEVLLVGHSHTVLGVDARRLELDSDMSVAKYARQGANAEDRLAMIRQYLDRNGSGVRFIVYDVDSYSFTKTGLSGNSYSLFFPFMGDPAVKAYLEDHHISRWQLVLRKVSHAARYSEVTLGLAMRGWLGNWTNMKAGRVDIARLQGEIEKGRVRKIAIDKSEVLAIEDTIAELEQRSVPLVLAFYPTIDLLNSIDPNGFATVYSMLQGYADKHENVTFLDFVSPLQSRHDLFYDPVHMNPDGQKVVSELLATELVKLRVEEESID